MARSANQQIKAGKDNSKSSSKSKETVELPTTARDAMFKFRRSTFRAHGNMGGSIRVSATGLVYYKYALCVCARELARRLCENVALNNRRTIYPADVQLEAMSMFREPTIVAGIACAMPHRKRNAKHDGDADGEGEGEGNANAATNENEPKTETAAPKNKNKDKDAGFISSTLKRFV